MIKSLTLVPVGGLANRMRTINSTIAFCKKDNRSLSIIWFTDNGLRCSFFDLFQPIEFDGVTIRDNSFFDLWMYDRPRFRNFRIPYLPEKIMFDKCVYENISRQLFFDKNTFDEFIPNKKLYMASFLGIYPPSTDYTMFKPIPLLQNKIDTIVGQFNLHTIGIHIRRSDNALSINNSPTELFIEKMKAEIAKDDKTNFYLASDSLEEKENLKNIFGERIISLFKEAKRNSKEGMQDSLVELYCLSCTSKIYGSFYSSFSETAAQLSGIPCIVLQKQG